MLGYAILNQQEYYFSQRGNTMSKQIHIRLEDSVYDALSEYTVGTGQSVQDCVSGALLQKFLVIWECCVKSMQKDALYEENMLTIIRNFLHSVDMYMELPAKPD